MNYLKTLNLSREPFSNTPDPEFFYHSKQHYGCLQKIEVAVRLKRGLNIVIGDVGSGKTTLCRQLIRRLAKDELMETHLILDPGFDSPQEFLKKMYEMLTGRAPDPDMGEWELKESIKHYLFRRGVEQGRIVVLIIDEGQKIPSYGLELLREFLNYETNDHKLLQIVLFAQKEFEKTIDGLANFTDRVNLYHRLMPLNFRDTRAMIEFRLDQARDTVEGGQLFSYLAYWAIYRATRGYPRKIINLCHLCTLAVIIEKKTKVDWFLVKSCKKTTAAGRPMLKGRWIPVTAGLAIVLLAGIAYGVYPLIGDEKRTGKTGPDRAQLVSALDKKPADQVKELKKPAQTAPVVKEPQLADLPVPSESSPRVADGSTARVDEQEFQSLTFLPVEDSGADDRTRTVMVISDESLAQLSDEPEFLGGIKVKHGDTVSHMIRMVYGSFSNARMAIVAKSNPHIASMEKIDVGQVIRFPAISETEAVFQKNQWYIELERTDNLEAAFKRIRAIEKKFPTVGIVPHWNPSDGLTFSIILRDLFKDEAEARKKLNQLSGPVASRARVVTKWDEQSVFFANPFGTRS